MPDSESKAVPNAVGLTQAAATTAITGEGLVVSTVTTAPSDTVPLGNVISQSPVAGTLVSPTSTVDLVVSSGPAQVAVPNVVGLTQAATTTAITGAGLVVGTVTTAPSDTVPLGNVISGSPVAGTLVSPTSTVDLVVSSGPAQVAVPNVVGLTQAAATTAITGAGLVVGTVTTAPSDTVPLGNVISGSPAAGSLLSPASKVSFMVSSGPKPRIDWVQQIPTLLFTVLALGILGIIVWVTTKGQGFLTTLADKEVARGLITFLIAITTVGIAVILAISTIVVRDADDDKRFDRGKQVLTTLIGVLGTIVGFYFGSSLEKSGQPPGSTNQAQEISIAPARLSNEGSKITLSSYVSGGKPPYTYSITFDSLVDPISDKVPPSGVILREITMPKPLDADKDLKYSIKVTDSDKKTAEYKSGGTLKAK